MREILFRGKRIDNGEWVYGYYVFDPQAEYETMIFKENNHPCGCYLAPYGVIPETVSEYTGLTVNGTKIFEGDIITDGYENDIVVYGEWHCGCCSQVYGYTAKNDNVNLDETCEVIGNIFDNPDLLKGGESE